ncbi:putative reverse transcriptase domain-containing protein [Tanacetum coccineum]
MPSDIQHSAANPDLGVLQIAMSSASSAVTYTSVYTNSEPGRVFWGADEEISDGGPEEPQTPRVLQDKDERETMFIQPHDPDYPLPHVDSPTAESPGYVAESDPEEDPKEYEDDETEDSPVDYPMDGGDDGDDDDGDSSGDDVDDEDKEEEDEEEEEEHLASVDSSVVVPTVEPVFPPEGTEPVIPPPSTDITITRARITVQLQAFISLPPEAEVERLLAMTTPSPSPPISLSPPSAGERLARIASTQALMDTLLPHTIHLHCHTTKLPTSLYIPPPIDRRDDLPESELPPRKRLCLSTLGSSEVGYGISDTWVDPAEAVPKIAPVTLREGNTRVAELAELHEHDTQDLYALLEDTQYSRTRISQRIVLVFQKVGDPICMLFNHMMSFLTAVVTSRYPTTNNQLRTSSNPRQQATIYDGKVTVQPVQGRQTTYAAGTMRKYTPGASGSNTGKQRTIICYNYKGEGHISKQCTMPKRKRDEMWFNDKIRGLADTPNLSDVITHNTAIIKPHDLMPMTLIVIELNSAKIALMVNLSRNGLDALTESQEKDTVIVKLKEQIKSLKGNVDDSKVKIDMDEIETLNIELEHRVTKLVAENEHLKQTYKQLYDSIKPKTLFTQKTMYALIKQVNIKSWEISDLNAKLQEQVGGPSSPKKMELRQTSKVKALDKEAIRPLCAKVRRKPHKLNLRHQQEKLLSLHNGSCGPIRVAICNGKKYILVIVDDYSRFTWVKCLQSKDEAPAFATNESDCENLGKLQPKADIGIFIGYAPTKKAFRIYNRRTRRIIETIHADFDELTAYGSEQHQFRPALHITNDISKGSVDLTLIHPQRRSKHHRHQISLRSRSMFENSVIELYFGQYGESLEDIFTKSLAEKELNF